MNYTRNDWYVACLQTDLADGKPFATWIMDEAIVLWQSGNKVAALEDRCVHRAAALSLGRCEGANLRCMYHGIVFDQDGVAVEIPGQDVIPPNARVRTYPAVARFGFIWVWMGNPADADPKLIPDLFPGVDLDDYALRYGVMDFAAEARLISDNLLDFSHLPFVHADSFQSSPDFAQTTMRTLPLERGVRFERWLERAQTGAFLFEPMPVETDDWLCYDYLVPGVLVMWIGVFPAGTARAIEHNRPDFDKAIGQVNFHIQTITPTSERTCRYHFLVGIHREFAGNPDDLVEKFTGITYKAFNEDKRMIEAQQRVIDRDPARPIMPTVHDRGITFYNRLKARLIAQEQGKTDVPAEAEAAL